MSEDYPRIELITGTAWRRFWSTEGLGYPPEIALTLGQFVAGSSALAKAKRVGIVEQTEDAAERRKNAWELRERRQTVRLLGQEIPGPACAGWHSARRG